MSIDIKHLLTIVVPATKVYQAITEENGLRAWWTPGAITDATEGSIAEFNFGDYYHNKMRITRLVQNSHVEWECIEGDKGWIGTRFVFELEAKDGQTIVRFTHGNWQAMTDFFASCNFNWGYYLYSLKLYCETGKGTPFVDKSNG